MLVANVIVLLFVYYMYLFIANLMVMLVTLQLNLFL